MVGLAGGCPAATHFLLLRQNKVSKEKATRLSGSLRFASGDLCCSEKAGVELELASLRQSLALIPLLLSSTGPARTGWGKLLRLGFLSEMSFAQCGRAQAALEFVVIVGSLALRTLSAIEVSSGGCELNSWFEVAALDSFCPAAISNQRSTP